jgi:endonuclease/exonuclease/phosphatase family metal-dependent hydrolase
MPYSRTARLASLYLITIAVAAVAAASSRLAAQDKPGRRLQITTYNIHHGAGNDACTSPPVTVPPQAECALNLKRIAATIRAFDSDIVALQEVDRFWARSGDADQPALLGQALAMQTCYGPNLDHQPDDHAKAAHQYGTLILSRYPIASCRNTLLPQPAGTEQRGLTEALITIENTTVRIYNTHLHTTTAARELQAQAIPGLIGTPAEPVVLVGDFNARPDAPELSPILARLPDAWPIGGAGSGFTYPAAPGTDANRRIDFIFVSRGNVEVVSASVSVDDETRMAADHLPVTAQLRIR